MVSGSPSGGAVGPGMGFSVGELDGDGYPELFFGYHFDGVGRPQPDRQYARPTVFQNIAGLGRGRRFRAAPLSSISDEATPLCHTPPWYHTSDANPGRYGAALAADRPLLIDPADRPC